MASRTASKGGKDVKTGSFSSTAVIVSPTANKSDGNQSEENLEENETKWPSVNENLCSKESQNEKPTAKDNSSTTVKPHIGFSARFYSKPVLPR